MFPIISTAEIRDLVCAWTVIHSSLAQLTVVTTKPSYVIGMSGYHSHRPTVTQFTHRLEDRDRCLFSFQNF